MVGFAGDLLCVYFSSFLPTLNIQQMTLYYSSELIEHHRRLASCSSSRSRLLSSSSLQLIVERGGVEEALIAFSLYLPSALLLAHADLLFKLSTVVFALLVFEMATFMVLIVSQSKQAEHSIHHSFPIFTFLLLFLRFHFHSAYVVNYSSS